MASKDVALAKPIISARDKWAVMKVLRSGNLAQGPEVKKFELEFSKLVEGRECIAVNSGTSGLVVALMALGISAGDEVIIPSFTFAATANAVVLAGAKPIFVDINSKTFNVNPEFLEKAITKRTKAIIAVHLYGLPADMFTILKIASKHKLKIIEDAAQAHLASIDGKPVGSFGDAAVFSFYPTKNMTSGEGGMVTFDDHSSARLARLLRNQGMEKKYENEIPGFNFRLTDIQAALGISQLKRLREWTSRRQNNAENYQKFLTSVETPYVPAGFCHVYHQYTIRILSERNQVKSDLQSIGIETGVYYPIPVHQLPTFSKQKTLLETEKAAKQVLSLPVHPSLKKRDLERIAKNVDRLVKKWEKK